MDESILPSYFSENEILAFLMATSLFGNLPSTALQALIKKFEVIYVNSGTTIIKQGDPGDCLYLVVRGRLRATQQENHNDTPTILNEIGRGELIGELALLTQSPRAATITAMRDSVLLKLSAKTFDDFLTANPLLIMPIVRAAISRITHRKKEHLYSVSNIVIAPAGDDHEYFRQFAQQFAAELAKYGATLHLNQHMIEELLSTQDFSQGMTDTERKHALLKWLSQQETQYVYIVYETDDLYSSWTRTCLRESDRILLVSRCRADHSLGEIENEIFSHSAPDRKLINLVLSHQSDERMPSGTEAWLKHRKIDQTYHVKANSMHDLHRVIRIVTGRSTGLVLGGGGARGLTYLGVYKALREMNIPIDWVGGASIGAMIGCGIAMGWSPELLIEKMRQHVVNNKDLFRYTLPLVSLNSGKALTKALVDNFGETTYFEDLWLNFFCIACNLTSGKKEVIQSGIIWKGIRATGSLPAVFPPITNNQGDMLVDGGMLNNLPVDIMRQYVSKVIAVTSPSEDTNHVSIPDGILSGWHVLFSRLFKKKSVRYPSIYECILKTMSVSSIEHEKQMINHADISILVNAKGINLLNFKAIDQLTQIGYYTTMEKLAHYKIPHYLP